MNKHTPGPLKTDHRYIYSQRDGEQPIAEVLAAKGAGASWANADLFSAASELLEACKNLLWHLAPSSRLGHATMRTDELRGYAEAAIAKGEGK